MLKPINIDSNFETFIIKKYYRGSLNFILEQENKQDTNWDILQEQFLKATINNPLLKKYPVKTDFSRLFLKKLINYLEEHQTEVHDELYTSLCMAMKDNNNDSFCYRHYVIGNDLNDTVIIRETNNMVVNGTTGMRTWEAAIMLSDWALCNSEVFNKKTVLELGSGVGFTGITIAKYCQTENMLLSDCHEDVLQAIEHNLAINFPSWHCKNSSGSTMFTNADQGIGVTALDWNDITELSEEICPDVIIGADIIYDPTILEPLCNVIHNFIQRNTNVDIFIAGVIRNEQTFNMFLECLDSSNLHYKNILHQENIYIEWDCNMHKYLLHINKIV